MDIDEAGILKQILDNQLVLLEAIRYPWLLSTEEVTKTLDSRIKETGCKSRHLAMKIEVAQGKP